MIDAASLSPEVWAPGGAVVALITGVCLVLANRYGNGANRQQRERDQDTSAVGGFVELTRELRVEVTGLRERVDRLEDARKTDREAIERITRIEQDTRRRYTSAVRYIRDLWQWAVQVTATLPTDAPRPPRPPEDLQTRLDEGE